MTVTIRGAAQEAEYYDPDLKFHSQWSIAVAAFIGGPLAASFLIMRNFLNLGKTIAGWLTLTLGIFTEAALYFLIPQVPASYFENVPMLFVLLIDTLIILMIVKATMGGDLAQHREYEGRFYSVWNAIGIGIVCAIISSLIYMNVPHQQTTANKLYDEQMVIFKEKEKKAMRLFTLIEQQELELIPGFVEYTAIPNWEDNLHILEVLDAASADLPQAEFKGIPALQSYSLLRIQEAEIYRKAAQGNWQEHQADIDMITAAIEEVKENLP